MADDDIPQLSREQLATLIPICPLVMDWLRNTTNHSADLFQQSFEEDYDSVAVALDELITTLQLKPNVAFATLTVIFVKYKASVWANSLRLILTQSQPRIIQPEVGSDLVGTIPRLNGACTVNEVCHILGPLLDKLPRSHFVTLGEFCALLRDTGTNATFLACLVGPQLLLPNLLVSSPNNQGPGALAAAAVMELLIAESESLFGRSASPRVFLPFGEFANASSKGKKADASIDFNQSTRDTSHKIAKASLRAFYDWRDPVKSTNTERLFQKLNILSIAQGLQAKYGVIPPGWGIMLNVFLSSGANFEEMSNKSDRDPTIDQLPNGIDADFTKVKLNNTNMMVKKSNQFQESDALKFVINEICESENKYYNTLNTFISTYCERLFAIVQGREGEAVISSLGLTNSEVELLFGKRLIDVKDVAHQFVASLGVLTDFQNQDDSDGRGQLGLLLDAFKDVFPRLDLLGPYMAMYAQNMKSIHEKSDEIRKKKNKKKKKNSKGLNFLQIWELERVQHENLKLSSLENVLIKPVQRIPHYKTLLKEIIKKAKAENHPALAEVEALLIDVEQLGQKIDRQVSSNKANQILGIGSK